MSFLVAAGCAFGAERPDHREEAVEAARGRALTEIFERREALGLTDPATQLRERIASPIHTGVVFRFSQIHQGVRVHRAELIVVVHAESITIDDQAVRKNLTIPIKPAITSGVAVSIALEAAKVTSGFRQPESELVVLPAKALGETPVVDRLAWAVTISVESETEGLRNETVFIDAGDGQLVGVENHVAHAAPQS